MKMPKARKHKTKKWEVSLPQLKDGSSKKFKVTRRLPELAVAETKVFASKRRAKKQFHDWLK
mgnify:CR=1 FL=1